MSDAGRTLLKVASVLLAAAFVAEGWLWSFLPSTFHFVGLAGWVLLAVALILLAPRLDRYGWIAAIGAALVAYRELIGLGRFGFVFEIVGLGALGFGLFFAHRGGSLPRVTSGAAALLAAVLRAGSVVRLGLVGTLADLAYGVFVGALVVSAFQRR